MMNVKPPPPPPTPHPPTKKPNKTSKLYLFFINNISARRLQELSTEKSAGVDKMPPKLVKLTANYLLGPLS